MNTKRIGILGALLAIGLWGQSAQAVTIPRDFTVSLPGLSATPYSGSLTYDNAGLTGSGSEILDPSNGFNTFTFQIGSLTYGITDDNSYLPSLSFPQLSFEDGVLVGLDFVAGDPSDALYLRLSGLFGDAGSAEFHDLLFDEEISDTAYRYDGVVSLVSVPEAGSTALLLSLSFVGLGWARRRTAG